MLLVTAFPTVTAAEEAADGKPPVTVRLLPIQTAVEPGETCIVGVHLEMADGWHVYWKNPGQAGLPTRVEWTLPQGFRAGPLRWPVPKRFTMPGRITAFGYAGEVVLITLIRLPDDLGDRKQVTLKAKVSWLACNGTCVPGQATVRLRLPVAAEGTPANRRRFRAWLDRLPRTPSDPGHPLEVSLDRSGGEQPGGRYTLTLTWAEPVTDVEWFPVPGPAVELNDVAVGADGRRATITFAAAVLQGHELDRETMECIVAYTDAQGRRRGVRVDVPLVAAKANEPKPATP